MKQEEIQHIVSVLNEALKLDHDAVSKLVTAHVPCNEALANHPTIQVTSNPWIYSVGLLGILNGVLSTGSLGVIMAVVEGDGTVSSFRVNNESPEFKHVV